MMALVPSVPATSPGESLVAAVDIGSNAMRLAVAACAPHAAPRVVHFRREPVRLGESVFQSGAVDEETVRRAEAAAESFRQELASRDVRAVRAVATQALRTALNGAEVIARIAHALGRPIELISADEEARLVRIAAAARLHPEPLAAASALDLILDLGGGSSQWSLVRGTAVAWSGHFPLGAVRLRNALRDAPDPAATVRAWLSSPLEDLESARGRLAGTTALRLVLVGGNAESLADLAGALPAPAPLRPLSYKEIHAIADRVRSIEPEQREPVLGLPPNRGDVLLPAALLFLEVMTRLGIEDAWIPRIGLKEGILQEMQERVLKADVPGEHPDLADHLSGIMRRSSRRFCRRLAELRRDPGGKTVHGIRVAARRLLAVLDLVEGALQPTRATADARGRVREVRRSLAPARDLQAAQDRLAELAVSGLPARVAHRLLSDRLDHALEAVRKHGGRGRARDAEARIVPAREALDALAGRPDAQDVLASACADRLRALRTLLLESVELLDDEDPASIHALRVALKKYRYAAETLQPFLAREAAAELPTLAVLQEELGAVQDLETLRGVLADLVGGEDEPNGLHAATWDAVLREQEVRMALATELVEAHEWRAGEQLLAGEESPHRDDGSQVARPRTPKPATDGAPGSSAKTKKPKRSGSSPSRKKAGAKPRQPATGARGDASSAAPAPSSRRRTARGKKTTSGRKPAPSGRSRT